MIYLVHYVCYGGGYHVYGSLEFGIQFRRETGLCLFLFVLVCQSERKIEEIKERKKKEKKEIKKEREKERNQERKNERKKE